MNDSVRVLKQHLQSWKHKSLKLAPGGRFVYLSFRLVRRLLRSGAESNLVEHNAGVKRGFWTTISHHCAKRETPQQMSWCPRTLELTRSLSPPPHHTNQEQCSCSLLCKGLSISVHQWLYPINVVPSVPTSQEYSWFLFLETKGGLVGLQQTISQLKQSIYKGSGLTETIKTYSASKCDLR